MKSFNKLNSTFFLITLCFVILIVSCSNENSPTAPKATTDPTTEVSTEATTGTVTDIDGNTYQTVKIGKQWWMAENLKVTHYSNGELIPNVSDSIEWGKTKSGALCHYANDEANSSIYGCLYNWYVIDDSRGVAPEGWHVPSDEAWKELEMYLGMSQSEADTSGWRGTDEGGKLKEAGFTHWSDPNAGANNESGFTALPAGCRSSGLLTYVSQGNYARFWSTTENGKNVMAHEITAFRSTINRGTKNKGNGMSIRCVRDN